MPSLSNLTNAMEAGSGSAFCLSMNPLAPLMTSLSRPLIEPERSRIRQISVFISVSAFAPAQVTPLPRERPCQHMRGRHDKPAAPASASQGKQVLLLGARDCVDGNGSIKRNEPSGMPNGKRQQV